MENTQIDNVTDSNLKLFCDIINLCVFHTNILGNNDLSSGGRNRTLQSSDYESDVVPLDHATMLINVKAIRFGIFQFITIINIFRSNRTSTITL